MHTRTQIEALRADALFKFAAVVTVLRLTVTAGKDGKPAYGFRPCCAAWAAANMHYLRAVNGAHGDPGKTLYGSV